MKACRAKPEQRAKHRLAMRAWVQRHPGAARARARALSATRKGLLTRTPCQIEGCEVTRVVGHHHYYRRPLEVLCVADATTGSCTSACCYR